MKISVQELREKTVATLRKTLNAEDASKVADYLLWAEASGISTQGILKLTGTSALQDVVPAGPIRIERDTKLSNLIDAGKNPAPLVSQVGVDAAIEKAKQHGFGLIGIHNIFSSNGAQAYYVEQIAKADLIGIMVTRSAASVAAFGGIDPVFGTNPVGFAFPTLDQPVVFDIATSAMTWYGLVLAHAQGKTIPENMAIDADGKPTTDPEAAMDGALLPFDRSYKGAGLGMAIEFLAGPLVGAAYGQIEGEWGSLIMAIDPELLIDINDFKKNNSDLVRKIKASRTESSIRIPGERAAKLRKQSVETGFVDVDEAILRQLGFI